MKHAQPLHPANVEELAAIAQETDAEVLHGAFHYPSESGGWQLGELDMTEHLDKYRDQEEEDVTRRTGMGAGGIVP